MNIYITIDTGALINASGARIATKPDLAYSTRAEQEAFSLSPDFANSIRTERIKIIRSSEYVPDFNQMIKTAMSLSTESGSISNEKHAQSIENKAFKKENINRLDTGGKQ